MAQMIFIRCSFLFPSPCHCKDLKISGNQWFLTWTQYIEPNETNDWFSGVPFFDVAKKSNDDDKAKVNMHLEKKNALGEKRMEWSLIRTLTHCQNASFYWILLLKKGKEKWTKSAIC